MQNVETLAHLALIARYGAAWFRGLGTPAEPGTIWSPSWARSRALRARDRHRHPRRGRPGRPGGASAPLQALLLGGYFGPWADAATAASQPFSSKPAALGAGGGAGLIAALPADACGLAETARAVSTSPTSPDRARPCLFGLNAVAGELERFADPHVQP